MLTAAMSTPCVPIANDYTPVHVNLDIQGMVELVLLVRNHLCLSLHVPASSGDGEICFAIGGGSGRFYSSGRSSTQFGGLMGNVGEGGKGFLQGGVGERAWEKNADTGFDGGGGPYGARIDAGGGGGYSEGGCGENVMSPVEEGEDLTILQGISKMNVVTI